VRATPIILGGDLDIALNKQLLHRDELAVVVEQIVSNGVPNVLLYTIGVAGILTACV